MLSFRLVHEKWQHIEVGDVIKLESNHHVTVSYLGLFRQILQLKDKSGVCKIHARKQTYQLLPRTVNFFPHFDVCNSCNFFKHSDELGQISPPLVAIFFTSSP